MRLSDRDIEAYLDAEKIRIEPRPGSTRINGVSVDLRLGHYFRVFNDHAAPYIDLSGPRHEVDKAINQIMGKEIEISQEEVKPFFSILANWPWPSPLNPSPCPMISSVG